MTSIRMPLAEAAQILGVAPNTVRSRYKAGKLHGERDNHGKIWVWVDPDEKQKSPSKRAPSKPSIEGDFEAAQSHIQMLTEDLAEARAEVKLLRSRATEADRLEASKAGLEARAAELIEERDHLRRQLEAEGVERRQLLAVLVEQRADRRPWWQRLLRPTL